MRYEMRATRVCGSDVTTMLGAPGHKLNEAQKKALNTKLTVQRKEFKGDPRYRSQI